MDVEERRGRCLAAIADDEALCVELRQRWDAERELAQRILDLRAQLRALDEQAQDAPAPDSAAAPSSTGPAAAIAATEQATDSAGADTQAPIERAALLAQHAALELELRTLQGENPLVLPSV